MASTRLEIYSPASRITVRIAKICFAFFMGTPFSIRYYIISPHKSAVHTREPFAPSFAGFALCRIHRQPRLQADGLSLPADALLIAFAYIIS